MAFKWLAIAALYGSGCANSQPVVDLGYSKYQGTALSSGVNQFLGIRYAKPPLGDLRWRAPVDPVNTTGIQNATAFAPVCLGTSSAISSAQSEDCLYVSVFAPANATSASKLPVWFFIQGGGYVTNSNANYNGSTVVANSGQGIVFVELNYRVGAMGFLASEKVRENGDLNVGLLDQRKALRWVKKHIKEFGGDPDHVVIHGESAGAGSVAMHLIAYGGRDEHLFIGAVFGSVFLPTQPYTSELEWQFERFATNTGCNGTVDELACLRSTDVATLQLANVPSPYPGQTGSPRWYWTPSIDGVLLTDHVYSSFAKGNFIDVPTIVGNDNNEGSAFAANASSPGAVASYFTAYYPLLNTTQTDEINDQYPLMDPLPAHAAYFPSLSAAYGEACFICPGNFIAASIAIKTSSIWNYHFNVTMTNNVLAGLGTTHTSELPAILGPQNEGSSALNSYNTYNKAIVPVVMGYYLSFVKTLDPNKLKYSGAPVWGFFGEEKNRLLLAVPVNGTMMETVPSDQVERCAFWEGLANVMEV